MLDLTALAARTFGRSAPAVFTEHALRIHLSSSEPSVLQRALSRVSPRVAPDPAHGR